MTKIAGEYYTQQARQYGLRLPKVMDGAQYGMGDPGVRIPIYSASDTSMAGRRKAVEDDYRPVVSLTDRYTIQLAQAKHPDIPLTHRPGLSRGRKLGANTIVALLLPDRKLVGRQMTGYLTDFRVEAFAPEELPVGAHTRFNSIKRTESKRVEDAITYLLISARHVVNGKPPLHSATIIEVAGQGVPDAATSAAGLGFVALADGASRLAYHVRAADGLLDNDRYPDGPLCRAGLQEQFIPGIGTVEPLGPAE